MRVLCELGCVCVCACACMSFERVQNNQIFALTNKFKSYNNLAIDKHSHHGERSFQPMSASAAYHDAGGWRERNHADGAGRVKLLRYVYDLTQHTHNKKTQ